MAKRIVSISLDSVLLTNLDDTRGLISRSKYVEKIIEEKLENGHE